MKHNRNVRLIGRNVILIPYERDHVEKYHSWMGDSELRELTASEPLSLDEEYEMQQKWCDDEDKCTFIVLSKSDLENGRSEIDSMVGDVNVFLTTSEEEGESSSEDSKSIVVAELEIMIAERAYRGRGFGREAVAMMIIYAIDQLRIRKFRVKIGAANKSSLKLFESLGFVRIGFSEIFDEVTLARNFDCDSDDLLKQLRDRFGFSSENYVGEME